MSPPFTYQPAVNPYVGTVADLLLHQHDSAIRASEFSAQAQGRALEIGAQAHARAAETSADLWGRSVQGIGGSIANIPTANAQAQIANQHAQLGQLQLNEANARVKGNAAMDSMMAGNAERVHSCPSCKSRISPPVTCCEEMWAATSAPSRRV